MWTLIIALLVFGFYKLVEPLMMDHEAWIMGIGWFNTTVLLFKITYLALSNFDMTMPVITILWLVFLGLFKIKAAIAKFIIRLIPIIGKIFNV